MVSSVSRVRGSVPGQLSGWGHCAAVLRMARVYSCCISSAVTRKPVSGTVSVSRVMATSQHTPVTVSSTSLTLEPCCSVARYSCAALACLPTPLGLSFSSSGLSFLAAHL